jgi:hypothetical protein
MSKEIDGHHVTILEGLHPLLSEDKYYSMISLRLSDYHVAIAECIDGWPLYLQETTNAIELYRSRNSLPISLQKPIDVTDYLKNSIQKSRNLIDVSLGLKRIYAFFATPVKKWKTDEKGNLIRENGNLIIDLSPQIIFLSQICTEFINPDTNEKFDLRFMGDGEFVEDETYGFRLHEIETLRKELNRPFYLITAENNMVAERNTRQFIRQNNSILEKGITALLPKKNFNRVWKHAKDQDVILRCLEVAKEVGKMSYVHSSIPHSLIGGMIKSGEITAFNYLTCYGPTGIGINIYEDEPTLKLIRTLNKLDKQV